MSYVYEDGYRYASGAVAVSATINFYTDAACVMLDSSAGGTLAYSCGGSTFNAGWTAQISTAGSVTRQYLAGS